MANILHLVRTVRTEDKNLFPDYTGDVYVEVKRDETHSFTVYNIYINQATFDGTPFNSVGVGSTIMNLADGTLHIKTDATTWVTVSAS